ncbi:hypothetical protein [Melittangium boletus]|uniref:hypothetical protein n=1 Tax=Melittangium boletus TaxID=83453 RepID=UPI003DA42E53
MSDSSEWKGGRIGPYEIGGRRQDLPEDAGEIHEGRHVETGAPVLALRPGPGMTWRPRSSWEVLTTQVLQPDLLIVHPRWPSGAQAPSFHELSLAYIHIAGALALLDQQREGSSFGALTPGPVRAPRRAVRWGLAGAVLAAGLALLLWPRVAERVEKDHVPGESIFFADGQDLSVAGIAYKMPDKPFKEQRKPPCLKETEVEVLGGCWILHTKTAPCPPSTAEYQGKCYFPVRKPDPAPNSVQP